MTKTEITQFKTRFSVILDKKQEIKDINLNISILSNWDLDDDCKEAIINAQNEKRERTKEYKELLSGKTFKEWDTMAHKIKMLESQRKKNYEKLEELKFDI